VLIGDPYQLPSVEAGNSLAALASSYSIPQVVLTEVFRQARNSTILRNAGLVNLERPFPTAAAPDFQFIDTAEPQAMLRALDETLTALQAQGFNPIREVHVLTPLNKGGGDISVMSLNLRLRDRLNPRTAANSFSVFGREFRLGDKVMQRRNDYALELFNGDIGYITANHADTGCTEIEFYRKTVSVPHLAMESIVLNYAMTVHKAQGSENRAVIFLATRAGCYFLLNKNLFYTAMTRAREKLVMIMPYDVVTAALRYSTQRHSHLATRLQEIVIGREPSR
ncbi:MAG TPA: ATP-binding domain-containing protein, partial [bacterium]|nr:ATP-binding domain-containing protein [bacterium]